QHLVALVRAVGHHDLRDARGALGLTQRQAGGRFTRDEAEALIERLEAEVEATRLDAADPGQGATRPGAGAPAAAARPVGPRPVRTVDLRPVPTEQLAAELQRRGWVVM